MSVSSFKYYLALNTATYLLNITPTTTLAMRTPHQTLFRQLPSYNHLHVFGYLCYPNLTAITKHKLEPRTRPCIFLGYALQHRGYRCLDLENQKVIISRHVIFDESVFLFHDAASGASPPTLSDDSDDSLPLIPADPTDFTTPLPALPTPLPSPPTPPPQPTPDRPISPQARFPITYSWLAPPPTPHSSPSYHLLSPDRTTPTSPSHPRTTLYDDEKPFRHITTTILQKLLCHRAFQYLTFTRPDISYVVQQICLHMHDPRAAHLLAMKEYSSIRQGYCRHRLDHSSRASCPDSRHSTSSYCVFLGPNLILWSSKRQSTVSRSSAEAEYRAVANVIAEACWLRRLLKELRSPLTSATIVFCDNVSVVYMSSNPIQHQCTKHIEINIRFKRSLLVRLRSYTYQRLASLLTYSKRIVLSIVQRISRHTTAKDEEEERVKKTFYMTACLINLVRWLAGIVIFQLLF
ncbi:LOW QUALITY PROTEIN: hypothetical protein V2J09_000988 [Rumex salicifolius]